MSKKFASFRLTRRLSRPISAADVVVERGKFAGDHRDHGFGDLDGEFCRPALEAQSTDFPTACFVQYSALAIHPYQACILKNTYLRPKIGQMAAV